MKTNELARTAGVGVETIRFYERKGLLPRAKRLANGYRSYGERHLERLVFIRRCRALDMPLADVRLLLHLMAEPAGSCTDVTALIEAQLRKLRTRLSALRMLERRLSGLRGQCGGASRTHRDCAILRGLCEDAT